MIDPGITTLNGNNFSGRTTFLRELVGLDSQPGALENRDLVSAYLGLDIINYFSGLEPTVEKELALHGYQGSTHKNLLSLLISSMGMDGLLNRNPFTLSGGEQTFFATLSALSMNPHVLSIDNAFEQLDANLRNELLSFISQICSSDSLSKACISDNRLDEYHLGYSRIDIKPLDGEKVVSPVIHYKEALVSSEQSVSIRIEGLRFNYPKSTDLLRGASFEFSPGQIYLLSGKNGAGKSTLCKLLSGILKPSSGVIFFNEKKTSPWKQPARHVAYHFQNPDMQLFHRTVRGEIGLIAGSGGNQHELITRIVECFGLSNYLDCHPFDLPYVLRKRLAMATSIAMGRPWLILDEPTLAQDQNNVTELIRIVNGLASCGVGIIIITHSSLLSDGLNATRLLLEDGVLSVN